MQLFSLARALLIDIRSNNSIHTCMLWTTLSRSGLFFRLRSRSWPPAGHSIAVATKKPAICGPFAGQFPIQVALVD